MLVVMITMLMTLTLGCPTTAVVVVVNVAVVVVNVAVVVVINVAVVVVINDDGADV